MAYAKIYAITEDKTKRRDYGSMSEALLNAHIDLGVSPLEEVRVIVEKIFKLRVPPDIVDQIKKIAKMNCGNIGEWDLKPEISQNITLEEGLNDYIGRWCSENKCEPQFGTVEHIFSFRRLK
jgi:hypothetical protein